MFIVFGAKIIFVISKKVLDNLCSILYTVLTIEIEKGDTR
jgi:hypothetical protein